jgi:hypothetical protein
VGGQHHVLAALCPRKRPGTHCIGSWVDPRAGLDGCGKSHLPPGFDPWTVQPVASRYIDYAIPAHNLHEHWLCKVDYKPAFLTCWHIQNLIMAEGLRYRDACKRAVPWLYIVSILYCLCWLNLSWVLCNEMYKHTQSLQSCQSIFILFIYCFLHCWLGNINFILFNDSNCSVCK